MFHIVPLNRTPVYEQLIRQTERFVLMGIFKPQDQVPSVRALSVELGVNPNTIQKAYSVLEQQGYTYSVSGRGSFAANVESILPKKREELYKEADLLLKKAATLGISNKELAEYFEKTGKEIWDDRNS